ncbi:SUKH-4 family immunity protein, partial [Streptomyces marokkonensis]|uniref:SUKH-4 family immunity protein n=1 Tax=Streptomyces marokkonensis TaxID=324855 RepID=UPI0031EA5FD3
MRSEVTHFLSDVGLPETSFFSSRLDLEDESLERIDGRPALKTVFEADGAECPPESERWEILGVFNYATIAIDPSDGRIYSFPEGEENYTAMNTDISSFIHSLIALEQGESEHKELPMSE